MVSRYGHLRHTTPRAAHTCVSSMRQAEKKLWSGGGRTRAARRGSHLRVQHVDLATRQSLPAHTPGTHARACCGREGPEARQSRCGGSAARASTTCRPRRCAVAMRRRAGPSSRPGDTAAPPSSRAAAPSIPSFTIWRRRRPLWATCPPFGNRHQITRRANSVAGRGPVSGHQVMCLDTHSNQRRNSSKSRRIKTLGRILRPVWPKTWARVLTHRVW